MSLYTRAPLISTYIGWAAGPLWGTYSPCCNDGHQWGSLEPGSLAADGSSGYVLIIQNKCDTITDQLHYRLYYTVWQKVIQPLLPKHLQKSGISVIS